MSHNDPSSQSWMLSFGDLLTLLLCFFLLLISTGALKPRAKKDVTTQNNTEFTQNRLQKTENAVSGSKVALDTSKEVPYALTLTSSDLVNETFLLKLEEFKDKEVVEVTACAPEELGGWATANQFAETVVDALSNRVQVKAVRLVGSNCSPVNMKEETDVIGISRVING